MPKNIQSVNGGQSWNTEQFTEARSTDNTWRGKECEQIIGDITQGAEGKEAYYLGAAVKYLYRYPAKGTAIKDLQKAKQYIDMLIELKGVQDDERVRIWF